jgi:hypothetical protein
VPNNKATHNVHNYGFHPAPAGQPVHCGFIMAPKVYGVFNSFSLYLAGSFVKTKNKVYYEFYVLDFHKLSRAENPFSTIMSGNYAASKYF